MDGPKPSGDEILPIIHTHRHFPVLSERGFSSSLSSAGDVKGYNSHASLYGVGEQQTSGSVDLLVLLLDVA